MRNSTVAMLYRLALLVVALLMLLSGVRAQTAITIGTGATGNDNMGYPCPIQDWYEGNRAQYLFRASELANAGMGPGYISAITYNVLAVNDAEIVEQYTIKIGTTAAAALTDNSWEAVSATAWGPVNYQPVLGANTFTFAAPFFWNGVDNLVVEVCSGDPSNTSGANQYSYNVEVPYTTNLPFNASHTYRVDGQGNLCATTSTTNSGDQTTRPNTTFLWTPAAACTGTPNAGTAVTSAGSVCMNGAFSLSLTGATVASGLTYQWQSSTDNVNWANIPNGTTPYFTTTQTVTTYYRCQVTCTNTGGGTASSASVQVTSPVAVAGSFAIDKRLPTGSGNFNSFNDAYNYIKCGISGAVTFNVAAGSGPYDEQLIMTPVPGASAANTITFNGNGERIAFLATASNERAVIKLNGADHIRFNNLQIAAKGSTSSQYGYGVQLTNDADSNIVSNCTIIIDTTSTSSNYAGIVISSSATSPTADGEAKCDGNTFSGNTITGGYYGLTLAGSNNVANGNNKIVHNIFREFYNYGLYIRGSFNTLIEGNTFTRPARTVLDDFYGIYATAINTRLNITRNRITNPFGGAPASTDIFYGIYFTGVDALPQLENVVSNNLVYNLTGSGSAYGIYNSSSDNVWYYHNTIVMDGAATAGATSHVTRGFYQTSQGDGINFRNNIITLSRGGQSVKHAVYFANASSTIVSDYNNFHIATTTGAVHLGYIGANQTALANWQQASTQDAHSLTTNPMYEDISTGNYKPVNASMDNRGTPLGIVAVDIANAARSATTPDIGAYEYTPPPCTSPPTPGTAAVSATPVCVNTNVSLSLTGNSVGLTQTYQWQSSDAQNGAYTNIGAPLTNPDTVIKASVTMYYRVAVTCGGSTTYSTPVLLTVNQALPANTYTINKGAPSSATNFVSFNAAKAALECGIAGPVIFNVVKASTPYNEQLVLDSIPGASAVNTVIFNGNGSTIKFSASNTDERAVIKLKRTDHITFDSLTIDATGTGSYGYGVHLMNNADSNTFRSCTIITSTTASSSSYAGIVINGTGDGATSGGSNLCDGNTFDGNTVTGGYYGVSLYGNNDSPVRNNRFTNNTVREFYIYGFYLYGTQNTLVEGNLITRPTRTSTGEFNGVYASGQHNGLTISRNRITNPFGGNPSSTSYFYGVELSSADAVEGTENYVINNIMYNINGNGYQYGLYNYSSANVRYLHNTISLDYTASTAANSTYGYYLSGDVSGVYFVNNIISITRGGAGQKFGVYHSSIPADAVVQDYNDFYVQGGGNRNYVGYNGSNQATIAAWQAATTLDAHSISQDPVFADAQNGNLSPVVSPLDNTGTSVNVPVDIRGTTRSTTTPDMGAFEISLPPCITPPNAGVALADPDEDICMGNPIRLNLSGNTAGGGQTYQWQSATSAAGPWINISEVRYVPEFTTELTTRNYFRCRVVCGGDTAYATPVHVQMTPPLLSGYYTINPGIPASATNFQTFASAVAALECGIAGWVTFLVEPGAYTERIRITKIPGAADTSRVTFQSKDNDAASVMLAFNTTSAANYVLKLDSASYLTWKAITVKSNGTTSARAIELAGTASFDSLLNCKVIAPATTSTGTAVCGIYANELKGTDNVIKGNAVTNGASGIYITGASAEPVIRMTIDSNTVTGAYQRGIYTSYSSRMQVNYNTVQVAAPMAGTAYGIDMNYADTAYRVTYNAVTISNATGTAYGLQLYNCDAPAGERGRTASNRVAALTGNTGTLYGLRNYSSDNNTLVNNVVSINTSGDESYALHHYDSDNVEYYNNSVRSTATSTDENIVAYFDGYGSNGTVKLRNNIFSHEGGGRAMQLADQGIINSDYNTLYTTGAALVRVEDFPDVDYATLQEWRDAADLDVSSIVYKPAFVSADSLLPDIANPEVWAIHGRGVQVPGNDRDFSGQPRPVLLTAGVPDMGAYEFLPAVPPPALPAVPAAPAPGVTQVFMFGTDTVTTITWGASAPADVTVRRYSGVLPPNRDTAKSYMYFYTDVDVNGATPYDYTAKQFYVDSWQGFIKQQREIRLGRTDAADSWQVGDSSRVNEIANVITEGNLSFLDKLTGIAGIVKDPPFVQQPDSSNRGTRFWVGYGHHQLFDGNTQEMVLYLSAEDSADVTVRINGTSWERQYHISPNSVIISDTIPKTGLSDARLVTEGWSDKGISITSNTPVVAYAHIFGSAASGATMLLPVGTYGYEYYALTSKQYYTIEASYSAFFVIADQDNTMVEITPAAPTLGGRPANVPFTVTLNKGEIYQVLGAKIDSYNGYDLTGSRIRSVPNANGKCYPIAVFSGSSRTALNCGSGATSSSGDNIIQQNFPSQAWGRRYLTAPTSSSEDAAVLSTNIYRVLVKDTATIVTRNGQRLTGLVNNRYYQYESETADYIEADQPIMMAQFMASSGGCNNTDGDGDPEMFFISPLEQGINKVGLYRNDAEAINTNYLTLIIPNGGLSSLTIDGSATFDHTYPHHNMNGYTVVVKRWDATQAQSMVQSDSAFTAVTYGMGSVESYGYNAGTLVKNLNMRPSFSNVYDESGADNAYTCVKTPFRFSMLLNVIPTSITWKFSEVSNLSPAANVEQQNPQPVDSVEANGRRYYRFTVPADYVLSQPGTYYVPITITHPDIESCNNTLETILPVNVIAAPVVDFDITYSGCLNDVAQFTGAATTANGAAISSWKWEFGDGATAGVKDTVKQYNAAGPYAVRLSIIEEAGCIGDTTKQVMVNVAPNVALDPDSQMVCAGSNVTFAVQAPQQDVTYNWYDASAGGNLIGTGVNLTLDNVTAGREVYVESVKAGCTGPARARGIVTVLPLLATPVVTVDSIGVNLVRFRWNAVPNAESYEVSINGGSTWSAPSSGPNGLTHTVTGLQPVQDVALIVKVKGCEDKLSEPVAAKTLPDGIYIPNAFSPNGDGLNDVLRVYGYIIAEMHMMIFNQWGEKVFETNTQSTGWDGVYKGKTQPSGVYIYVCRLKLMDGTAVEKKGTINLIR